MSECNFLCDFKIITVYPMFSYLFYLFCKKCYNYILVLDTSLDELHNIHMYDNTYKYDKMENKMFDKSTSTNDDNYYNNVLFAFNQIPT
jgi:hypothetical protein